MKVLSRDSIPSPTSLFECIEGRPRALLESVEGPQHKARFSLLAWGSLQYLSVKDGVAKGIVEGTLEDPRETLRTLIRSSKPIKIPGKYTGGPIGYFSYDFIRYFERINVKTQDLEKWPDLEFFIPENIVVYDHINGKVYVEGDHPRGCTQSEPHALFKLESQQMNEEEYKQGVSKVLEYIREGYTFQTVISNSYTYSFTGDLMALYRKLREINPSPYMFFIDLGERKLVGSSPETLFRVEAGIIESFPIAGTRPRGKTEQEDLALEQELLASEKERAEHLMLVDLARNDVGRVSKLGTVKVPEFMYIEKYSHVQHIVSRVVGDLEKKLDSVDVLVSTFPAGTVSGAPKPMSMNIIEEIEKYRRGPYAGAVGYFSADGGAEFAISIRTAFANSDRVRIQAGAGIVYDSIPEMEYMEVEHKMAALKRAMKEAGGE